MSEEQTVTVLSCECGGSFGYNGVFVESCEKCGKLRFDGAQVKTMSNEDINEALYEAQEWMNHWGNPLDPARSRIFARNIMRLVRVIRDTQDMLRDDHKREVMGHRCEHHYYLDAMAPKADHCYRPSCIVGETPRGNQYWLCSMHKEGWDGKLIEPYTRYGTILAYMTNEPKEHEDE